MLLLYVAAYDQDYKKWNCKMPEIPLKMDEYLW